MKKLNLIFALLFFFALTSIAQKSKINFELAQKTKCISCQQENIDVFIKGDVQKIKSIVEQQNGHFKYAYNNIAVANIRVQTIPFLIASSSIQRIEHYTPRLQIMADTMLAQNNVYPIHNGDSPLTQAYTGSGIVIGVIDTGIDITHPDFKNSNGTTRIKYLWDQRYTLNPNSPGPYNYGQEWDNTEIDNGDASVHDANYYYGHGTHITGVAAGNGLATGQFKGVAPDADIVMVALDFNGTSPTLVTDAVEYIYAKAQAMGKPCVINCSFGDYTGSHDGKDLQAQLIKNMINAQNGRALVAAAGNGGHIPFHLGYTVSADTNFTMFSPSGSGEVYIQMWADTNNFKNVDFSIGADQLSPNYSFRGRIPFSNIQQHLGVLQEDTLYNAGNRIGIIQSYGDVMDDVYSMEFNIIPDSTDYKWRLITTGNGAFDSWSFNMVNSNLPSANVMTDSIFYKKGDLNQTIVSSFQCLDDVITVGNYINRRSHINYYDTLVTNYTITPGARVNSSSSGPTRDGRIKPDIMATGDKTISCLTQGMLADFITYLPGELATSSGFHKFGGGTSAASPVVAGIAALYLEKNPNATAQQLKQAVISCTKQDNFTGTNLPNNTWGYGKVDAFTTLTGCVTTSINNVANSNGHQLIIYPNPSNNEVNFNFSFVEMGANDKLELNIYNAIGKLVKSIKVNNTIISINNVLPAGMYHCELILNGQKYASEKMIILLPE